jgi:hypothetical protein
MVCPRVMFTLVIGQIFLTWVPNKVEHILCNFVVSPEKYPFHQTQALLFDSIVRNVHDRCVVAMDGCFKLRVAQVIEDISKNNPCLVIVVKCPQFCFRH